MDELCRQIDAGLLAQGDKLISEAQLMHVHQVSRSVVRDALSRLQAKGLVETRHGIGSFVLARPERSENAEDLELLEFRLGMATAAAGLAAGRRSEQALTQMRRALDEFHRTGDSEADFHFHRAIASGTGNSYFLDLVDSLKSARQRAQVDRHQRLIEYERIYHAIAGCDVELAKAAMRQHLSNSLERLQR